MIRLDKYLADMGIGARSEVKQYIRKRQVLVNGSLPKGPEQRVVPGQDQVTFQGKEIPYIEYEYFMLHKPQGYVSAVTDSRHKTVLDLISGNKRKDLFPVGRLDLDTEGLLLLTNDGALSHDLLSPGKHVAKTYFARIAGRVTAEDAACFAEGVDIGEKRPTLPTELRILSCCQNAAEEWVSEIELVVTEGKFHQVKRMFQAVGKHVVYLKRISMGPLRLDGGLQPGEYRRLTREEIDLLKKCGQACES